MNFGCIRISFILNCSDCLRGELLSSRKVKKHKYIVLCRLQLCTSGFPNACEKAFFIECEREQELATLT